MGRRGVGDGDGDGDGWNEVRRVMVSEVAGSSSIVELRCLAHGECRSRGGLEALIGVGGCSVGDTCKMATVDVGG